MWTDRLVDFFPFFAFNSPKNPKLLSVSLTSYLAEPNDNLCNASSLMSVCCPNITMSTAEIKDTLDEKNKTWKKGILSSFKQEQLIHIFSERTTANRKHMKLFFIEAQKTGHRMPLFSFCLWGLLQGYEFLISTLPLRDICYLLMVLGSHPLKTQVPKLL